MADLTATFEAGANGANVTTGAGEASASKWDNIFGTAPIYSNTHAAHGLLAAKITTAASQQQLEWNPAAATDHYGRFYMYQTANPGTQLNIHLGFNCYGISLLTDGRLRIGDAVGTNSDMSTSIALNQWIRIEYHVIHSATVGLLEMKLFNNADSTTPTEVITTPANRNTGASCNDFRYGSVGSTPTTDYWFDSIVATATSYPGPVQAFTATFETGINGATISNAGGEASATAWLTVEDTPVYSNTHAAHGALAAKITTADAALNWATSETNHYGRIYLYATANPSVVANLMKSLEGGGTVVYVAITSAGKLQIQDFAGTHNQASSISISLNQWIRVEWHVINSATVGQIEAKLFNSADSTSPTEIVTSPANWNTGASTTGYRFADYDFAWGTDTWLDDIVANATSYPGPAPFEGPTPNLAPVILGRGAC